MNNLILGFITWNADPIIVNIGPLSIRWYSLLFATGFLIGFKLFEYFFKNEGRKHEDLDDLLIYMFAGTVLGARIGHCLFYDFKYYFIEHPIEIFKIWEGGLASHGAFIGIVLALFLYARKKPDQSFLWVIDRMVIPVALAGALIRTGNFFNSEIVGIPTNGNWGVLFQRYEAIPVPRVPVQLFEAFAYFPIFILLLTIYFKTKGKFREGMTFGWFLVLVFTARFFLEYWKVGEKVLFELNRGQLLSIPVVMIGLFVLSKAYSKKKFVQ